MNDADHPPRAVHISAHASTSRFQSGHEQNNDERRASVHPVFRVQAIQEARGAGNHLKRETEKWTLDPIGKPKHNTKLSQRNTNTTAWQMASLHWRRPPRRQACRAPAKFSAPSQFCRFRFTSIYIRRRWTLPVLHCTCRARAP